MIDIILVTNERTKHITDECVKSIKDTTEIPFEIFLVDGDKLEPFNYNRALNTGASHGENPYILFCNNDLIFKKGWDSIIKEMKAHGLRSASPYCPKTHTKWWKKEVIPDIAIGAETGKKFAGWCFCWERSLWNEIGLSEKYQFWCSDNVTTDALKEHGIKHALVKRAEVIHMFSRSLNGLDKATRKEYTHGALKDYLASKGDAKALKRLESDIKHEEKRKAINARRQNPNYGNR